MNHHNALTTDSQPHLRRHDEHIGCPLLHGRCPVPYCFGSQMDDLLKVVEDEKIVLKEFQRVGNDFNSRIRFLSPPTGY